MIKETTRTGGQRGFTEGLLGSDGFDMGDDDAIMAVISDIEERLEHIRESHRERCLLEVDLAAKGGELASRRRDILRREELLTTDEGSLISRSASLAIEQQRLGEERSDIAHRLSDLERFEAELEARQRDHAIAEDELERERDLILAKRSDLQDRERSIGGRAAELSEQAAAVEAQRDAIEQAKASLESDKLALAEQAKVQDARAQGLQAMQLDLERREQELQTQIQEHDRLRSTLGVLTGQLDEARQQARAHADEVLKAQREREETEKRSADLEVRCRTLETERTRIQGELTRTRRELDSASAFEQRARPALALAKAKRVSAKATRRCAAAICIGAIATAAFAAFTATVASSPKEAAAVLGFLLAGVMLGSSALAGRLWDSTTLLLASFGATFGLWLPKWVGALQTALSTWDLPTESLSQAVIDNLPLAVGVTSAGLALTFGLALLTSSLGVLAHATFATLLAGVLTATPDSSGFAFGAAIVLWHGIIAATLTHWAVKTADPQPGRLATP